MGIDIRYDESDSSIFTDNKNYCEDIISSFQSLNATVLGTCSCYGFLVEVNFNHKDYWYQFIFKKEQSTQAPVAIWNPVAMNAAEVKIVVNGLNGNSHFKMGRTRFRRFLMPQSMCTAVPAPLYVKGHVEINFIKLLFEKFSPDQVFNLLVKNNTFRLRLDGQMHPEHLLEKINQLIAKIP